MSLTARRQASNPTLAAGVGANTSRGLEWLWQELRDVRRPHLLDCGQAHAGTLEVLLGRASKLHVADLVPWLAGGAPELWDQSGRTPVYRLRDLLAKFPPIPSESLNAVFCWQLLDLVPPSAQANAVGRLLSYLRPGGVLFCLLREPALAQGADVIWGLEDLTTLSLQTLKGAPFTYPPLTNRQMGQLAPSGNVKTFLTRSGIREVLILK